MPTSEPAQRRRHWFLITLIVLVCVLAGLRVALPGMVKNAVNRRLEAIPAYTGRVDDISISILRGAYTMNGLNIEKREKETTHPFVSVEHLDFSLAWKELFHGQVVSEIVAQRVRLNFVQAGEDKEKQQDFDRRWQDVINDLFPVEITHLEITDSELHFVAPAREPPVDIFLRDLHVRVRGLCNRPDLDSEAYPATVLVEGKTPGNGTLSLTSELEPLAAQPRFHLRLKVDKLSLPAINQFLQAYANVDVSAGEFTGYLEMVARNGKYEGYMKPFFENLVFSSPQDKEKNLFSRLWEKLVAGAAKLLKNDETDQVALRVPFSGEFGATSVSFWESARTLLRNAFIEALREGLDGHPRPKGDEEKVPLPPKAEEAGVTK